MANLLDETIETLKINGKTEKDVLWVGCNNFYTTWEHFKSVADIEYDEGFGGQQIATDLLVVGDNWWLERGEYDGSEWWEFKELPKHPLKRFDFTKVEGGLWSDLAKMNKESEVK